MLGIITSGNSIQNIIIQVFAMIFAMLIALSAHEWAHGYIAYKNGDLTAKFMGRLTLNPLKHIDPIGFSMLLLAGFGWAKPVPIDSNNFRHYRKGIISVSLAGVTMNLILATCFMGLLSAFAAILNAAHVNFATMHDALYLLIYFFISFFQFCIAINLTLMAFNILPIFPLDGFHIVEAFTKYDNKFVVFMRRYGNMILLGLILISSVLGRFAWYLDIFGMYIGGITKGVMQLFYLIFPMPML